MVSIFKKNPEKIRSQEQQSAARRAARLSTADLADWADVLVSEAGRNLTNWRRDRVGAGISEFRLTVDALGVIAEELSKRAS